MINVLFVDLSPAFGGAQQSLIALLAELIGARSGTFKVGVLANERGEFAKRTRELDISTAVLPASTWHRSLSGAMNASTELIRLTPQLRVILEQWRADIVIANGTQSALICALALPRSVPFIFHQRDYAGPTAAVRLISRRAQAIVAISDFIRDSWIQRLGRRYATHSVTIYNGFDFDSLRHRASQCINELWADRVAIAPVITLIADMVTWKRHDMFLDAMMVVGNRIPNVHAFVIGGAREQSGQRYFDRLVARCRHLGLENRVTFTGYLDDPLPLLARSAVMVSVAQNEPFGRTIIEALVNRIPIVMTPGGGPDEIAGGHAMVRVVADNAQAVADGVTQCLNSPTASGTTVVEWADVERFSIHTHAEAISQLMYDVLEAFR